MDRLIPRIPIAAKIFGISLVLLVLLVLLSSFVYLRTVHVTAEMDKVTGRLVPLLDLTTVVNSQFLDQQVLLERMQRQAGDAGTEGPFREHNRRLDAELQRAKELLAQALEQAETQDRAVELARLEARVELVAREHEDFREAAAELVEMRREGAPSLADFLSARLAREEEGFDLELASLLAELQRLTDQSGAGVERHEAETLRYLRILLAAALVLGLAYSFVITLSLVRPLRALLGGTQEVGRGNLSVRVPVTTSDEIGELTSIFNSMVEQIREKERLKATFGHYMDPRVVDRLLVTAGGDLDLAGRRKMSVFFSDVAGFSSISEMLTPSALVSLINEYLTLATEPILASGGVIDQFIGDAVVAFWGPPFADAREHARLACEAALAQRGQLEELRRRLPEILGFQKGLPTVDVRIGLATGDLVAGSVGSEHSKSFTVLGAAKSLAERLEGWNKKLGTRILLSEATRRLAGDTMETRQVDRIRVASDADAVAVFELLGRRGDLEAETAELRDAFEAGLSSFYQQDFSAASQTFEACLGIRADDPPSALYLKESQALAADPPGDGWDGVRRLL